MRAVWSLDSGGQKKSDGNSEEKNSVYLWSPISLHQHKVGQLKSGEKENMAKYILTSLRQKSPGAACPSL